MQTKEKCLAMPILMVALSCGEMYENSLKFITMQFSTDSK